MKYLATRIVNRRWMGVLIVVGGLGFFSTAPARAQLTPERLAAVEERLERIKTFAERLPEQKRQALSGGALNLIHLAEHWDQIEASVRQTPLSFALKPGSGSDPNTDVAFSSFAGFTQSETSTGWCNNNVVIGFNDSGSVFEQLLVSPSGSISFNGFTRSTNKGGKFTDLGFLPSDPVPPGSVFYDLGGDPVVQCTDENTFYYASLATNFTTTGLFLSEISVSKSADGGASFGGPVPAASKDGAEHFLDKPWMAVDPTDPLKLYVTYTDFDFSGSSGACGALARTAIELVRSTDGGLTWSAPVVIAEVCDFDAAVQGSQVVVGSGGEVHIAWEAIATDFFTFFTQELDIRKSTDMGVTFGPTVKIDDVTFVGDAFSDLLQGAFRAGLSFPSLAVDRSGQATNGNVYIAWHDGRNLSVPDFISGVYNFADILVSNSTDGGVTWSAPVQANDNAEPLPSGRGTDQYQPGIAVDRRGDVGVCFYDRRRDDNNFLIDRFCAKSTDAGAAWRKNSRRTRSNWAPVPAQDFFLNPMYMGDYDELASDFMQTAGGFVGGFGDNSAGNPDVNADKF